MSKHMSIDIKTYMAARKAEVETALEGYLPSEEAYPESLHKAMRYSVFSGGKRFRPILCLASFGASGGEGEVVMPVACAIEMIHTYSLIHDDLPCMDDDDLRRGRPTNHKVFGEAIAVLAGDALLTHAIELVVKVAGRELGPERCLRVLEDITRAIGVDGMVAGQVVDMESEGKPVGEDTVSYIHSRKTGALITSTARCGAIAAGADEAIISRMTAYGEKVGLAFQITDDILDVEGGFGDLKSGAGLDSKKQKATYPGVHGLERSKSIAAGLIAEAADVIADLGEGGLPLKGLAELVVERVS
jgi:geranylgeranyl diphosphate synthase type II